MTYDNTILRKNTECLDEKIPQIGASISICEPQVLESTIRSFGRSLSVIRIEDSLKCNIHRNKNCAEYAIQVARHHHVPVIKRVQFASHFTLYEDFDSAFGKCFEDGLSGVQLKLSHDGEVAHSTPFEIIKLADEWNLDVYFEIDDDNLPILSDLEINRRINNAMRWFERGAVKIIAKATRDAILDTKAGSTAIESKRYEPALTFKNTGKDDVPEREQSFPRQATLNVKYAELLITVFGLNGIIFKTPTTNEQSELLSYFGKNVQLCDIQLSGVPMIDKMRRNHTPFFSETKDGESNTQDLENDIGTFRKKLANDISDRERWESWFRKLIS
jgi:hypothetical protein